MEPMAVAVVTRQPLRAAPRNWRRRWTRRRLATGSACSVAGAALIAVLAAVTAVDRQRIVGLLAATRSPREDSAASEAPAPLAFLARDEKDGRFCGKEGDTCKCFGRVRYGRLFSWSDDLVVDGSVNCSAQTFGDPLPLQVKICKCYPTICTTDVGTCTPEPCCCPTSRDPESEWAKKTLLTSDGMKCWACEKRASVAGVLVDGDSPFCPTQIGRCSLKRSCKCASQMDTKRVMRTKEGQKCWTCAPPTGEESGAMGMDADQKAMFWMLPLLWPFLKLPESLRMVCEGCPVMTAFLALCVVGYLLQNWVTCLQLNRFFSFFAPCMRKGELWRLFTYFMLHSDLQHLFVNLLHLLDALDLEGVPDMEVSPGAPLRCTRDGPPASVCYPDVSIGSTHVVMLMALVLAYGALVGTIHSFGAFVQGASSVCFGVDGALIALYAMFLGAGLENQLNIPEFGSFFWMRIGIIAFHIVLEIIQSICGGKETVGTLAHMASLVAGFSYVVLVLPPMGHQSLFDSERPYIVSCGLTSPKYVTLEEAAEPCLAFFYREYGVEVATCQFLAKVVLLGGIGLSVANAVLLKRHIGDDGVACCSCGDEKPHAQQEEGEEEALLEARQKHVAALSEDVQRLEWVLRHLPPIPPISSSPAPA